MVEKLIQHKHCIMCGKAIPADEELCSEKCKMEKNTVMKKKRTYVYMMYGAIIVMVIFLLISLLMTKG